MNSLSGSEATNAPYGVRTNYSPLSSQPSGSDIRRGLGKGDVLSDCSSLYGMKVKFNLFDCDFVSSIPI